MVAFSLMSRELCWARPSSCRTVPINLKGLITCQVELVVLFSFGPSGDVTLRNDISATVSSFFRDYIECSAGFQTTCSHVPSDSSVGP